MSNYVRKSIALTLGAALASTGLLYGFSSHAQSNPGTVTPLPSASPSDGSMTKPAGTTTTPDGTMTKPSGTMTPDGTMTKPSGTMTPNGTMTKPSGTMTASKTIVDVAAGNPSFTTLVKAIKAADLVTALSSPGPYTVFAPTNAAFNKLPKGTLEKLLRPENKTALIRILNYHVVRGNITSALIKTGKVKTLAGPSLNVTVSSKQVNVNSAKVTKADIKTSNGVIHVIDTVLIPPKLQ